MSTRKRYDYSLPGTRQLAESIVHGAATTEGTMVAFPTCFPAVTEQVPGDESRIRAMDVTPDGIVYAGTSGYACHLLVGMFHGITGVVFDMGVAEEATECVAFCCGTKSFAAAVNGPKGGRLAVRDLQRLPFDLIQEWHFWRKPYTYVGPVVAGEPIVHAVTTPARDKMVGITTSKLFVYEFETQKIQIVGDVAGAGRLACGADGSVYGADGNEALWRYSPAQNRLERRAVKLPEGTWDASRLVWARDEAGAGLYMADTGGRLFHFGAEGFKGPLATVPLSPIGTMAVTRDGRLFASAGDGIARMFCYRPETGKVADLGVAVSVFERRRYGYCFGDAVVGRDGEIIWGENDDLGHLWLYFPSIQARK
jgi:hypothetical protein